MRVAAIRQQSDCWLRNQLEEVLENELDQLQQRILETAKGEFFFTVTGAAKGFLLLKGSGQRSGAQHLKLAIERHIVFPLADLFATDQILTGDVVCIDWDQNQPRLTFTHEQQDLAAQARLLVSNVFRDTFLHARESA